MDGTSAGVVLESARVALAVMWTWAAYAKLRTPVLFADSAVKLTGPLPEGLVRPLARTLPGLELLLAVTLLLNETANYALYLSAAMLVLFAIVLLRGWRLGIAASCRCFGGSDDVDRLSGVAVVRTALLAVAALIAASLFPDLPVLYTSFSASAAIVITAVLMVIGSALVAAALRLRYEIEPGMTGRGGESG